jgi:ribosomal protein S18 acetylase RimI-like enzyme
MVPVIKSFSSCSCAEVYALFADVYSTSGNMSQALEEKYPDFASFESDFVALQTLPGGIALIAEIAHKPAAYVVIRPRSPSRLRHTADLNMGVVREARGQGIGRLILQASIDQARMTPGLEIVYLMVRSDNSPAVSLYERVGFEKLTVLDRDTKINSTYFDGVLMRIFVDT